MRALGVLTSAHSELLRFAASEPRSRPFSSWVPMVLALGSYGGFPPSAPVIDLFRPGFLWLLPWVSMVFALGSYGVRPGFLWFSLLVPKVFALVSYGFLWFSLWFPMVFSLVSYGFLWFPL